MDDWKLVNVGKLGEASAKKDVVKMKKTVPTTKQSVAWRQRICEGRKQPATGRAMPNRHQNRLPKRFGGGGGKQMSWRRDRAGAS